MGVALTYPRPVKEVKMIKGSKMTEESKLKMSLARQGEKNHRFGKHCSEETKRKISEANKGKTKDIKNPKKSHPHTEEWKIQHSDLMKGSGNPAFGTTLPEERKNKISETLIGRFYGEDSGNWKGGIRKNYHGYIIVSSYNHPFKSKTGCVLEHRLVMEDFLGRYLKPEEVVHHINGDRTDNRIENLMLFATGGEHRAYHNKLRKQKIT